MRRLRFFRILLPLLLVPFVVLVVLELRRRPEPLGVPEAAREAGARAEGIQVVDIEGARQLFRINARSYSESRDGEQRVEGVERLEVSRKDASPLIVRADTADIEGEPGKRIVRVHGGIDVRDPEAGMRLSLPTLEVDEAAGEARSEGDVRFSAPGYDGRADALVYGLDGQPTRFEGLELRSTDGAVLRAAQATFVEGSDVVELDGGVELTRGETRIAAPRMTARRGGPDERLQRVDATGGVTGKGRSPDAPATWFQADDLTMQWGDDGRPSDLVLGGHAVVEQGTRGLSADRVHASRPADGAPGWDYEAEGNVSARGAAPSGPATLQADRVRVRTDGRGQIVSGRARGDVRFDAPDTAAQAAEAELRPGPSGAELVLVQRGDRRARLASSRYRVSADRLVTRPGTAYVDADGRVEATLLPAASGDEPRSAGFFAGGDAVHFVARSMNSSATGDVVKFSGSVRGWQGERHLSADEVELHQAGEELAADGDVATRIPRLESRAATEADYVQVSSDRLRYRGADGIAEYSGSVRVRQAEGWLECDRLEIRLDAGNRGIEDLRAFKDVRIEFRSIARDGMPQPVQGSADRAEYVPKTSTVRLFGDARQATVTRLGERGGTTQGRVLRYRLDTGTLEVESGGQERARIKTSDS